MCHLLGLAGDPYAVLLTLEGGELAPLAWQPRTTAPTALRTQYQYQFHFQPPQQGPAHFLMSTLFISDIHLCAQRPDMTAALVRFLAHDAPGADAPTCWAICLNSGLATMIPIPSTARWPTPLRP